jgi:glycosyltransferase involved in cell wall biosynthesis
LDNFAELKEFGQPPLSAAGSVSMSVVLPNFNHAERLPCALRALLRQSLPPDEILVVDDGSTDSSVRVIEEFARQYPPHSSSAKSRRAGGAQHRPFCGDARIRLLRHLGRLRSRRVPNRRRDGARILSASCIGGIAFLVWLTLRWWRFGFAALARAVNDRGRRLTPLV